MTVLIVTHSYAPDASPRAFRWSAIAEHWAQEGAEVHVLTTGRRGGAAVERRNGVVIHHVGEAVMGRVQRRSGVTGASDSRNRGTTPDTPPAIPKVLRAVYDATWRRVFWPDYACLWYRPALAQAKRLCQADRFDAVITVSHPFTGHLAGLTLKRSMPGMRWIADVGDPFSLDDTVPSNNQTLYRRLNRHIEAAVLRECDAVSVTVAGCAAVLADEFAADPAKFHVIPPLLSLPDPAADGRGVPAYADAEAIDLVYLGVLYPTIRPPDGLLALFAAMHARRRNLRLHFFGDATRCTAAFERHRDLLGKAIRLHGPISRGRVAAAMGAADVLVNIGNDTPHQLPSKLVEYVAAGKPILNVARSGCDTSTDFLGDYPAALSLTLEETAPTTQQIEHALAFVARPPAVAIADVDRLTAQVRAPAIADMFARLIPKDGRHGPAETGIALGDRSCA